MAKVEFFYDLSSPWTRLAFHNIQPIIAETNARILWRPFLVGGVFNAVNDSIYASRADMDSPKNRNVFTWLKEWAKLAGVPMNFPSRFHPLKSVHAMRFCCALEQDQAALFAFTSRAFDAYFTDQRNLDDPDCLTAIANECGLDGATLAQASGEERCKNALRRNTQEAIDRGAFGSPTIFVNDSRIYFGNDQLPLVRQALLQAGDAS